MKLLFLFTIATVVLSSQQPNPNPNQNILVPKPTKASDNPTIHRVPHEYTQEQKEILDIYGDWMGGYLIAYEPDLSKYLPKEPTHSHNK